MNARPVFWPLVGWALLLSAAAALAHALLRPWLGAAAGLQLLLLMLSLAWLAGTLRVMPSGGRSLAALAWLLVAAALCWWQPALWLWLLALGVPLWISKTLAGPATMLHAACHAALQVGALVAALVALRQTQSVFWLCWCWLLVQSLAVLLPGAARSRPDNAAAADHGFDRARQSAEVALRQLARP